jgi:multicomponent Na+:H+ antiporter subunit D
VTAALAASVAAPFAGALAAALLPRHRRPAGLLTAAVTATAVVVTCGQVWRSGVPAEILLPAPGGLDLGLLADGLALAMLLMTAIVGVFAAAFATAEAREGHAAHPAFWPVAMLLWGGLNLLFLAQDLFTIYLALELIAVTGAALVAVGGDRRTVLAAIRYFLAEFAASALFLLGMGWVWRAAGSVRLDVLPTIVASDAGARVGLALMTVGLLLKVPLVPLHFWLPAAHALAPSAVSPLLSALVVKSSFAVIIRLWFLAAPDLTTVAAAQLLGAFGAAAVVWGSLNALRARRLKVLVAHSTVAQLGFLFLLVPIAQGGAWGGWSGGVLYAVAHALAKASLLMVSVGLTRSAGSLEVGSLGGSAARRPLATFALGVAAVSLVGLPPTGGFVAKWYLLVGSIETGQWWWVPVIVAGTLLTAAYLMRVVRACFAPSPAGVPVTAQRPWTDVVALLLALSTLVMGLRPMELLELVEVGAPLQPTGGG